MSTPRADIIAQLQKEMLLLNGIKPPVQDIDFANGLSFMQQHFPQAMFPLGAVHEFICADAESSAATCGFISGVLSTCIQVKGATVWINLRRSVFPPALQTFNIDPGHLIFVHPRNEKEILWVAEEALKCEGLTAVVAEMKDLNFVNSRRFQLAVEKTNVTGFIMNQNPANTNNACVSRWMISSLPSIQYDELPGVGFPRWNVALKKIRNGKPGSWEMEWVGNEFRQVMHSAVPLQKDLLQKQTG